MDHRPDELVFDPMSPWAQTDPYVLLNNALAGRGVERLTPNATSAEVLDASFSISGRSEREAIDHLRNQSKRLLVDFFRLPLCSDSRGLSDALRSDTVTFLSDELSELMDLNGPLSAEREGDRV